MEKKSKKDCVLIWDIRTMRVYAISQTAFTVDMTAFIECSKPCPKRKNDLGH